MFASSHRGFVCFGPVENFVLTAHVGTLIHREALAVHAGKQILLSASESAQIAEMQRAIYCGVKWGDAQPCRFVEKIQCQFVRNESSQSSCRNAPVQQTEGRAKFAP